MGEKEIQYGEWTTLIWGYNSIMNKYYFANNITQGLGSGWEIAFWSNKWEGNQIIKETYSYLFALSSLPNGSVAEMGK